jgi:transposase
MLTRTQDNEEIIERVALDIGKAERVCCARVLIRLIRPAVTGGGYLFHDDPRAAVMADRLAGLGTTRVVMEATSDCGNGVLPAGSRQARAQPAEL